MVRHGWKFVGKSNYADIYVDYNAKKSKFVTKNKIYIHKGIYPYHDPKCLREMRRA